MPCTGQLYACVCMRFSTPWFHPSTMSNRCGRIRSVGTCTLTCVSCYAAVQASGRCATAWRSSWSFDGLIIRGDAAVGSEVYSLPVTTLPDATAPRPTATFSSISEESVAFRVSQDEPGVMYVLLAVPGSQSSWQELISPGAPAVDEASGSLGSMPDLLRRKGGLVWATYMRVPWLVAISSSW